MPFPIDHYYLTRQLIAYIGNKRSLLGFLYGVFSELAARHRISVFLDPFAGSGSVSRLARMMGFQVLANDWEFYSRVINECHLAIELRDMNRMFQGRGGIAKVLETLNNLSPPREGSLYIARYYAPMDTRRADYRRERLFYTRENALRIDAMRNRIEEWYPGFDLENVPYMEKMSLLALLLYQCATHTNTSGVFKACHKGFGGHGRDALKRIMGRIELDEPVLFDARQRSRVFSQDASDFVSSRTGDLCYLDPPYTGHQYGSNYHLLNTVALWDKPAAAIVLDQNGRLKRKAGIREDWVRTRSPFCYRDTAPSAFETLLGSIDCRFIILSYNTEGIVPFEELLEILSRRGRVGLYSSDYVKYRGGKQSLNRQNNNLELLLVVERGIERGGGISAEIRQILMEKKFRLLLKCSFIPERIRRHFETEKDGSLVYQDRRIPMPYLYRFDLWRQAARAFEFLDSCIPWGDSEHLAALYTRLSLCVCTDKREEVRILLDIIARLTDAKQKRFLMKRALWLLKKFAFRKYSELFWETFREIRITMRENGCAWGTLERDLVRLANTAVSRFSG
ncbi:MAG TPA: DNA adenine methylase [Spirochaetia bacterium]|nr:DNA adenine methylase [Spirochaetia bacterium]